jgi:hypothetical protein
MEIARLEDGAKGKTLKGNHGYQLVKILTFELLAGGQLGCWSEFCSA